MIVEPLRFSYFLKKNDKNLCNQTISLFELTNMITEIRET